MVNRNEINKLAEQLNLPYDHSKQEVKNLDKLVELVRLALENKNALLVSQV